MGARRRTLFQRLASIFIPKSKRTDGWVDALMARRPSHPHLGAKRSRRGRRYIEFSDEIDGLSCARLLVPNASKPHLSMERQLIKAAKRGVVSPRLARDMMAVARRSGGHSSRISFAVGAARERARRAGLPRKLKGSHERDQQRRIERWRRSDAGRRLARQRRRLARRRREHEKAA